MRHVQVGDDLLMNNGAFSEVDLVGTHISGQFDLRNSEVADLTPGLLDKLHPKADFVPCPPVSRGKEVSADAMMHPACRVMEAKAFLLHAQNAVLEWAFNAR
jgi:ornithine carbamoyltransferase